MSKLLHFPILGVLLISLISCDIATNNPPAPVSTSSPAITQKSTSTIAATGTPKPTSTPAPTSTLSATPTAFPTLVGFSIPASDPRLTNPELFDLKDPDAPIPLFVNALKMAGLANYGGSEITKEQVAQEVSFQEFTDAEGYPFIVAIYHFDSNADQTGQILTGPVPLAILQKNQNEEWVWEEVHLKTLAEKAGINIGVDALDAGDYPEKFRIIEDHFSQMTIEAISLKRSQPDGTLDLHIAQSYLQKAINYRQTVTFQHLVYQSNNWLPDWFREGAYTRDESIEIMQRHINNVMHLMRGLVENSGVSVPLQYVVVNEGGIWEKFWHSRIGADYIELAFVTARAADPEAILIYNDYGHEAATLPNANAVFKIVKSLKDKGLIDGVGMQMHFLGGSENLKPNQPIEDLENGILAQINRYAQIGVEVFITELDVDISKITGSPEEKALKGFDLYRMIPRVCVKSANCAGFTVFGIYSDSETSWIIDLGGVPSLLFSKGGPTVNYYGVLAGLLDSLPKFSQ